MNDYRNMTDAELSRKVAEALGYQQTQHGWWCDADNKLLPDPSQLPEFASDIGAAMTLFEKMREHTSVAIIASKERSTCLADRTNPVSGENINIARAIAECFLAWHEQEKKS